MKTRPNDPDSTKLRKNEYKELEKEGLEGFEILVELG